MLRTFAYFFDGKSTADVPTILMRQRTDPRFAAIASPFCATVYYLSCSGGHGGGVFVRPEVGATMLYQGDDDSGPAGQPAYRWTQTEEPGLYFGMAIQLGGAAQELMRDPISEAAPPGGSTE